jgi:hypothetical protein
VGDPAPYLFRTQDYGAHWTAIAGDLPAGEIVHVVRQDLRDPSILYAGSETGVWLSGDGGAHWQRFNNNLPTASVHDMRIQPRENDLLIATHGRGFWVLDDLTPIEALAQAGGAQPLFFEPRTTYMFFRWWAHEYGSGEGECCAPQNMFAGDNPPDGAVLSYYLPHAMHPAPAITVQDGSSVIAHVGATGDPGINRAVWELADDPPVPWRSARPWNQGPSVGAPAVPGTYTVTVRIGNETLTRALLVKADPRARWTQADYVERRDFLRELFGWLSHIDQALNNLDGVRANLFARITALRASGSSAAELSQDQALLREAQAVSAELSSNPRNSEDDQWRPDRLRERLLSLIDVYSALSLGPPLAPHRQEAAGIKQQYDRAMAHYDALVAQLHRDGAG